MTIELKVPAVGESIQEVQIGRWLKQQGESVSTDESVVELETDKASMEVPAPSAGVLTRIVKREGESVAVGDVIAYLDESGADSGKKADSGKTSARKESDGKEGSPESSAREVPDDSKQARAADDSATKEKQSDRKQPAEPRGESSATVKKPPESDNGGAPRSSIPVTPSARRALREHGLSAEDIEASGKRLRAKDVEQHVEKLKKQTPQEPEPEKKPVSGSAELPKRPDQAADADLEQVVPMTLIRKRIAKRLVEAQQTAALLTTFNEIDMSAVMQLREKHREGFQAKYGIKLGFMSFFVKALIDALKQTPALNAEIREGFQIAYRNYYHIGVAIGGGTGLVVPVLQNADRMSFAQVEQAIADFAKRAQQRQLKPQELEGGTFTISNGGVYGSLLSTPIVNPPQSGVLGMHTIQERPVARGGQVVIRPMMYVALTYDHRIVDGSDSVMFLRRIKEAIEEPARMLVEV